MKPEIRRHILIYGLSHIPLLVYDEELHRIEITHGQERTIIRLPKATAVKFTKDFNGKIDSMTERFIYNENGRIVASFLPETDTIIIRHHRKMSSIQLPARTMFQIATEYVQ